ncbi:TetR/AcrR family transcriptional regulator [Pseudonocardiaceae bacterium YIM PH 21723]|nr:TetR/AcrR family transcriptional regulator [Pseudonocardiaceae bacterium YIM PH 21723]
MDTRERIITAAAKLLADQGADAFSTRAVAEAAAVQAPTLYRLFGDKQGLIDAVTDHGFERYLGAKMAHEPSEDPVADLRAGWDHHTRYGLENPDFYALMFGSVRPGKRPAAAQKGHALLVGLLGRIAAQGRLWMPADLAGELILATNVGVTLALISTPEADRDAGLSARAREIVIGAIIGEPAVPTGGLASRALALDQALREGEHVLSVAEGGLMHDWLHRIALGSPEH